MKIVLIGGRGIGAMDGITSYMYNLATKLAQRGHDVVFYCESDNNSSELINGFRVVSQKSLKNSFVNKIILSFKATLKTLLKEKGVDIIHYNAIASGLSSLLPLALGRNVVLQNHGQEWLRTKFSKRQRWMVKALYDFVIFFQKNITAVSCEHTKYIIEKNKRDCVAIPCAASDPIKDNESDILNRFGLSCNDYFLFMGRFGEEKNIDILIEAYIRSGITDKKLVLAGGNEQNKVYEKYLYDKAEGCPNIIFTGPAKGLDKEKLIEGCFVYCLQSTSEGMPIALLEGMSYSKVCISSEIVSCKEALGESGIYVKVRSVEDLMNKMIYVTINYNKVRQKGDENRKRIQLYYNWDRITDMYESFYTNLICK